VSLLDLAGHPAQAGDRDLKEMIGMWVGIGAVAFLLFGIYAFVEITGVRTRFMNRHTDRSAEDLYDDFADSGRGQRRHAERRGVWRNES
jgi:hypothetical protein